jgi:hypothetical protein
MTHSPDMSSFGKFIPGFEFLQSMSKPVAGDAPNAVSSGMPNLGGWVAPTLDEEALNKRIDELKAVSFWLDQNAAALKATIQALEVQKMTLATLKSMNFSFTSTPVSGVTDGKEASQAEVGKVDALQWWNALTQQFGSIASKTIQEAANMAAKNQTSVDAKTSPRSATQAKPFAKTANKTVKSTPTMTKTKPASK